MKTINDYQMFFQGYLEALTDIDGAQREFGVLVRMFNSTRKEHLLDIQREFEYQEPIKPIYTKKFRNFYSVENILEKLIFVNFFNGAKVPKKSLNSFRSYVRFHLMDYIDFSFDDASYKYGKNKDFEIFAKRGKDVNAIFLVMHSKNKKLVFRFYRNKKYVSDKAFDKWYKKILKHEEKARKAYIKKHGMQFLAINSFIYKDYDKRTILRDAEVLSICSKIKSDSIEKICNQDEWKLKELISVYRQGLNDIYGDTLASVESVAKLVVNRSLTSIHYDKMLFQTRLDNALEAIEEYNKKFHSKKSLKKYKDNNRYGHSISIKMHDLLSDFEKIIKEKREDKKIAKALKKKYKKETMLDVWKAIICILSDGKLRACNDLKNS